MNPLSLEKLLLIADICHIGTASRILDLASGKGEMLCQFAAKFGSTGIGIDIHPPVVADARARAQELGVAGTVEFIEGDAAKVHWRHVDWQRARRHIGVDEAMGQTGRLDPRR
jgi:cyclopropane fatty-acyl-phospholipid synthase-like methyltransferase